MLDPLAYYSPEIHLFPTLSRDFALTGQLSAEALYLILDWKAPRARTKHRDRLAGLADGSFDEAARRIANALHKAAGPEQRLEVLMTKWRFALSTASAILAVLYPDAFTVYDIHVCTTLCDFDKLAHKSWSAETWREYQRFMAAVRKKAPSGLSLRDGDRWLWGKNKQETLATELDECRRGIVASPLA